MLATLSLAIALKSDELVIDPLLIAMAAEVWSVAANDKQTLWPGWDASATPLLFYLPNEQDLLINHPNPPEGFRKFDSPIDLPFDNIYVRDGETVFSIDGQNTTREVNGVETLVVSDTLSQRKQWVQSLVGASEAGFDGIDEMITNGIKPNPYSMMGMIAHEAFHAHQALKAPNKGGNEMSLMKYPALSPENNAGYALESEFLKEALLADNDREFRGAALKWMAVRHGRRQNLLEESIAYEDGIEFSEGLAMSMEYRLYDVLEGRTPDDRMFWAQGFYGYDDMTKEKERLIDQAQKIMSGEQIVNNDLYGASPVRFRLYSSGMLVAALIDKITDDWQEEVFETDSTLTNIAREGLDVTDADLDALYTLIQSSTRYKELFAQKTKLAQDGEKHIEELLSTINSAPTTLVLDLTEWAGKPIGLAITPFGILRVDDQRRFHRLIPFRAMIGKLQISASSARPIYHDSVDSQYVLDLNERVTNQFLDDALGSGWQDGPIDLDSLELPGATVKGGRVTVSLEQKISVDIANPSKPLKRTVLTVKVHFPG